MAALFLNDESVMVKPLTSDEAYIAPPFEFAPVALFDIKFVFSTVNPIFAESVISDLSAYIIYGFVTFKSGILYCRIYIIYWDIGYCTA